MLSINNIEGFHRIRTPNLVIHPKLQAEGQSYSQISADTRLSLARELISTAGLTVQQVSDRTGYSEPASFIRAYRNRFGQTPGATRNAYKLAPT